MAALRMASLWERRVSGGSDESGDLSLESGTYRARPPQPKVARPRSRTRVSAKKPPVAPPLATGSPMIVVEEVPLVAADSALLEGMSPVSSFVASMPSSPGVMERCAEVPVPGGDGGFLEEVRELRMRVASWDRQMARIELKNRRLMRQVARLNTKYGVPR